MLMSVRSVTALASLSLAAVVAASCGGSVQQVSPLGPSAVTTMAGSSSQTASAGGVSAPARISDDNPFEDPPPPADEPDPEPAPAPAPAPGPAPGPAPAPVPGAPAPAPEPAPAPAPAPPVPVDPNKPVPGPPTFSNMVKVRVDPDPVPYSGRRIELFSCRDNAHTWFYTHLLTTETGIGVTFTERENFFDGIHVSTTKENMAMEGNSGLRIESRWCSAFPKPHTAQHRYKGKDANGNVIILMGPLVHLLAIPGYVAPPPVAAPKALSTDVSGS